MKLHAIVDDLATAEIAVDGGATVIQLRAKGAPTAHVVAIGRPIAELCRLAGVSFVVNDNLAAAFELSADGVHLGRGDPGAEQAVEGGLILGLSAASVDEAVAAAERGATYIGAGPIWPTPTKPDADSPIGLDGLAAICSAVSTPVVAIGGIDPGNAAECFAAGASGVAVVRAASESRALREVIEGAGR